MREIIKSSQGVHGIMFRSMVVCYLVFVMLQTLATCPWRSVITEMSRTLPWCLEIIYFSYSFYLSLLRHSGGPHPDNDISFFAKVVKNYFGEFTFLVQAICTFRFWLYIFPTDVYDQRSMLSDVQYFGISDIILCADYYTKVGAAAEKSGYLYTGLVYCCVFLPISLLVPILDGNVEGNITKIVPLVVLLAFVDTTAISHKVNFMLDNLAYFEEAVKATLGLSYHLVTEDMSVQAGGSFNGVPGSSGTFKTMKSGAFASMVRAATNIGNELVNPVNILLPGEEDISPGPTTLSNGTRKIGAITVPAAVDN